jgi:hypothetical protein
MASRFAVCNGDADGLCAAVQWHLHDPAPAALITGMKREIALLEGVVAARGDEVDVFDLSFDRNRAAVLRLLAAGVRLRYFDHHAAADLPTHPLLELHIDHASDVCTSLLVDRRIAGACRRWALVGAYGDNLSAVADALANASGIDAAEQALLRRLGEAINYNAYGDAADATIAPARLFEIMSRYDDPRDMLAHESVAADIEARRQADLERAGDLPPRWQAASGTVHVLPDAAWSRRVLGCLANALANAEPERAHAVLKAEGDGYAVSVRAPLRSPWGAHELCRAFGGGGRARAAGIDRLPAADVDRFTAAFANASWARPGPA